MPTSMLKNEAHYQMRQDIPQGNQKPEDVASPSTEGTPHELSAGPVPGGYDDSQRPAHDQYWMFPAK